MTVATEVLVVGAGPVGLLLTAELRRRGVDCRLVEKLTEPLGWVKALGVSQRTLEMWDQLGLAAEALEAGLILRRQRVFVNRAPVLDAAVGLPEAVPYQYPLLLPQPETERLLTARLMALGGKIERGVELQTFFDDGDGVQATLARQDGPPETIRCRYLVGCDGAHSAVRRGLGLAFEGGKFPVEFLLADVALGWEFEHPAACLFLEVQEERLENLLVCIPYRDRAVPAQPRYRLSTMARPVSATDWVGPGTDARQVTADQPTLDQVRALVNQFVPVPATVSDLRWSSVFRISHRLVSRYRVGRAFLVGDAAHIHPPTGGQGMNTGLQDAFNLAWKLALTIQGKAADDLLDSYDAERRPVGLAVVERTKQRSLNIGDRSTHDVASLRDDSQLYVNYRSSPWVAEHLTQPQALAAGPQAGARAPDVQGLRRPGAGYPVRLFDLLRGTEAVLFTYGPAALPDEVRRLCHSLAIRVYQFVEGTEAARADPNWPTLLDAEGNFRTQYGIAGSAVYLIRPDGIVGFRTDAADASGLSNYLRRLYRS